MVLVQPQTNLNPILFSDVKPGSSKSSLDATSSSPTKKKQIVVIIEEGKLPSLVQVNANMGSLNDLSEADDVFMKMGFNLEKDDQIPSDIVMSSKKCSGKS
jgi:hypothetical protein